MGVQKGFWECLEGYDHVLLFETDSRFCGKPTKGLDFFTQEMSNGRDGRGHFYLGSLESAYQMRVATVFNSGLSLWSPKLLVERIAKDGKDKTEVPHVSGLVPNVDLLVSRNYEADLPNETLALLFGVESVYDGSWVPF